MIIETVGHRKLYLESQDTATAKNKKKENFEFSRECPTGRFTFVFLLDDNGTRYSEISIPAHAIPAARKGRMVSWSTYEKKYTLRYRDVILHDM